MPAIKPSSGGGDRPNTAPPRSTRTENSKPSAKRPTTAASAAKKKPSGTALGIYILFYFFLLKFCFISLFNYNFILLFIQVILV